MNLNYNLKNVKNDYLLKQKIFEKETNLEKIFNKYKNNNQYLGKCNIVFMIFKVNENSNNDQKEILDLYQIFDYLREKKLGNDLPFIKYGDESFNIPMSLISTEAIYNNKINKLILNDWIGINKITNRINGIMIKKYLKDYNDQAKYVSMILRKNNELSVKLSFDADDNVDLYDASYSIKNIKKLVEDINKNLVSKKVNVNPKIDPPDVDVKNDNIILKKNTMLKYCNIIIPFIKKININFNELYEFSKNFPEYLYDENKDLNNKNKQKLINGIKLRYKKISGFIPMSDIIKDIDILKSKSEIDIDIIQIISKKYGKTQDEVSKYILEWKKIQFIYVISN